MAMKKLETQLAAHKIFGQFRFIKKDGEIWFAAVDVCKILGLKNPSKAVQNLNENDKHNFKLGLPGKDPIFINEPGFYNLIFQSRKPEARKIQDWVYHEVLPSIRKYGYYVMPSQRVIEVNKEELKYLQEKYPNLEIKKFIVDWVENEELKNGEGKVVMTYEVCLGDF